ncbi:siroheme synthase [Pseudooctadecabacter sp.]|uniref:siroheme synthase family protein n=1 Tax=Pseudooctadecabacter sp. TaxID=1966338 RepID=UPI00345916D9
MKTFPMFLQMEGRRVVVVGGGEQAAQKTRLMLKTQARIDVVAPTLDAELAALSMAGRIFHRTGPVTPDTFADTALVFVATGCPGADMALHGLAKAAGAVVNVVDQPALCDAMTPSIVDRDPVVVAIGTEGTAPVLARQIKTKVEELLEPRLGDLAALAGRMRPAAAARLAPRARRDLWRWVFNDAPRRLFASGAERAAAGQIKQAIDTGDFGGSTTGSGSVAIVGAGPGAKDLMTLRGVQRLQEADVIFFDRRLDPDILELARRDAERVHVGAASGCDDWPQSKIAQTLVAAAKRGQRVVYLQSETSGASGPATPETDALTCANIPFEIVPGVRADDARAPCAGGHRSARGNGDTFAQATLNRAAHHRV